MVRLRKFSNKEIGTMIENYLCGARISDLAKKFHCRKQSISDTLKRNNVAVKSGRIGSWYLNEEYFDVIDSAEKAYFVGLLFTDGSVGLDKDGRSPMIRLEISENDIEVLYMLRDELQTLNLLSHNKRDGKTGTYTLCVRSKKIADALSKYNIIPNKTYLVEHLPQINEKYLHSFIHGLIDGDGSVYYSKIWHINFCSHSKKICEDFESICSNLIGKEKHMAIQCSDNVYRVTYNGQWAKRLGEKCMTDNYGMARKRLLVEKMLNEDKVVDDIV